jgi:putative flippase GtrA
MVRKFWQRLWKVRILRFAAVGASGTVLGLGLLYVLTSLCGVNYLLSNAIVFIISATNNYVWNTLWTFKDRLNIRPYGKYVGANVLTFGINEFVLWILTSAGIWYILSATIATIVAFAINYVLSRRFVWRGSLLRG